MPRAPNAAAAVAALTRPCLSTIKNPKSKTHLVFARRAPGPLQASLAGRSRALLREQTLAFNLARRPGGPREESSLDRARPGCSRGHREPPRGVEAQNDLAARREEEGGRRCCH